jgi:DNA repair protein RecN (Recombination protein N)
MLGMAGGRFAVELVATDAPQSFGARSTEFLVAGHAGATPRALAKVASGGELSRIALAVAVVGIELQGLHERHRRSSSTRSTPASAAPSPRPSAG